MSSETRQFGWIDGLKQQPGGSGVGGDGTTSASSGVGTNGISASSGHSASSDRAAAIRNRNFYDRNESVDLYGFLDMDDEDQQPHILNESGRNMANLIASSMLMENEQEHNHDEGEVAKTNSNDLMIHDDTNDNNRIDEDDDFIVTLSETEKNYLLMDNTNILSSYPPPALGTVTTRSRSAGIPIPISSSHPTHQHTNTSQSQASSHESSGTAFMTSVLNQNQAATILSHTPPSAFGTSYETRHFGKRARAGSISSRLLSASEYLEGKGLLLPSGAGNMQHDRAATVGMLKDLIIIGDEELQNALDKYETEGDPTALEEMIQSGALQNRLPQDLDLLGDLDLDFLTMDDASATSDSHHIHSIQQHHILNPSAAPLSSISTPHSTSSSAGGGAPLFMMPMQQPPLLPTQEQMQRQLINSRNATLTGGKATATTTHIAKGRNSTMQEEDDGIGDLEFAGEFVSDQTDYVPQYNHHGVGANTSIKEEETYGTSPASQSILSDADFFADQRLRSNSLFSALGLFSNDTNVATKKGSNALQQNQPASIANTNNQHFIGQWSDIGVSNSNEDFTALDTSIHSTGGIQIKVPKTNKKNDCSRRKSTGGLAASLEEAERKKREKQEIKEQLKEQKKKERQERKQQKDLEKQEKKQSKKEAAAAAAATAAAMDDDEDVHDLNNHNNNPHEPHISGSGLPRSLSDPNLRTTVDEVTGLVNVERPDGWIGAYSPDSRKVRIDRFLAKRPARVWIKTVKYDVRKNFADSRLRVKGRFVKKEDELLMRELMSIT